MATTTERLRSFRVRRGRNFNLDRVEAGTGEFVFNDQDGMLDPSNANGPYYGRILPLKPITLARRENSVTYRRFTGPIERYEPTWFPPSYQEMTIQAADSFETLANLQLISDTASLTTALSGADNDLVYTARKAGGQGDDITVTYVVAGASTVLDVGTNDPLQGNAIITAEITELPSGVLGLFQHTSFSGESVAAAVNVQGSDITVTVGTNAASAATSTASQIKTALDADEAVMALVSVALAPSNTGSGVVTAMVKTNLSGGKFPAELSGARINRVLDRYGWSATKRQIDAGVFTLVPAGFAATENASVLSHLQDCADSELGYVFMDGAGNIVYHDGAHRSRDARSLVSQATFSDDGAGFPYTAIDISLDKDRIWNEVTVTAGGQGSIAQTVQDSGSQTAYGRRTVSKGTQLLNDSDAAGVAAVILAAYKDPKTRFERISLIDEQPIADNDIYLGTAIAYGAGAYGANSYGSTFTETPPLITDWTPAVLGREIGDRVTVRINPPAHNTTISYDCFVESIEDERTVGQPWRVSFNLTPVTEAVSGPPGGGGVGALLDSSGDTFTLDSATLGVLG